MPDEVPAALPLLTLIAGLAAAALAIHPSATSAWLAASAILLLFVSRPHARKAAVALLFFAAGIFLGARDVRRIAEERSVAKKFDERFVTIEAPIDRDWAVRGQTHVLRCRTFTAGGRKFDAPLSIYASFDPAPIELQSTIRATGFLRASRDDRYSLTVKSARLVAMSGRVSPWAPATWNRLASIRLRRHAGEHPKEIAMIEALVLGRGERLSEEARQNFRRGGTYHLLVFSGMQIALAAAIIAMLLRRAGSPRASDWSLLGFAVLAPLFIGPTASVSRSSIGIGLYALSRLAGRPTSFENLWCLAAIVDLGIRPGDLIDPAFHLTYAGAGALIFLGKVTAGRRWRWISYALSAELAVIPLTLFHFHQYALGGSLMTIVLTPIVFVMLIVGAMFCVAGWPVLLTVIAALNVVCTNLNDLAAPASGFFASPSAAALAAGFVSAIAAIAFARGRRRTLAIAVALTIPTVAAISHSIANRSVAAPQVTFLDVGQGDSILVRSGAQSLLVDGGGRSDDMRFGESVLLPLLVDRGLRRIDIVVLSHPHPDHCGGLAAVMQEMKVRELWLNPRRLRNDCAWILLDALRDSDAVVRFIRDERRIMLDETAVHALVPRRPYRRAAENNSSVVLHLLARRRSVLLTGDIEREAEAELSERFRPADVMKVPHHGSRSSTTAALLDAVRPRIAIISCGARNWFGHPHPEVLRSLQERHVRVLRTDRAGTIDVKLSRIVMLRAEIDTP